MPSIRKILVPVNFTEPCRQAAKFAVDLASDWQAEVCLLHVFEQIYSMLGFGPSKVMDGAIDAYRRNACHELNRFAEFDANANVQRTMLEGDAGACIARFARTEDFSLILMPTRGLGVFRRLLIGSVTAKVLHDADCPVWTGVRPEAATANQIVSIRRIACAVDLGAQSKATLSWAAELCHHWNAALTIIHVVPLVPDVAWRDRLARMAREQITSIEQELNISGEVHTEFGAVPSGVTQAIKHVAPDLVVIGRGHLTSGGRLHDDAYAIIRDSSCPVVSI